MMTGETKKNNIITYRLKTVTDGIKVTGRLIVSFRTTTGPTVTVSLKTVYKRREV